MGHICLARRQLHNNNNVVWSAISAKENPAINVVVRTVFADGLNMYEHLYLNPRNNI